MLTGDTLSLIDSPGGLCKNILSMVMCGLVKCVTLACITCSKYDRMLGST